MIILTAVIALNVYIAMDAKDVINQHIVNIVLIVNRLILVLIVITVNTVLDVLINHINNIW